MAWHSYTSELLIHLNTLRTEGTALLNITLVFSLQDIFSRCKSSRRIKKPSNNVSKLQLSWISQLNDWRRDDCEGNITSQQGMKEVIQLVHVDLFLVLHTPVECNLFFLIWPLWFCLSNYIWQPVSHIYHFKHEKCGPDIYLEYDYFSLVFTVLSCFSSFFSFWKQ